MRRQVNMEWRGCAQSNHAPIWCLYIEARWLFLFSLPQHWPAGRQPRTFISFSIIFSFFFPLSSLNNIRFPNSPGNLAPALYFSFCVIPVLSIPENIHNFTLLVFPRVEKEKNPNEKIVAALRLGFCYCPENFNWMPFEKKSPNPMRNPKQLQQQQHSVTCVLLLSCFTSERSPKVVCIGTSRQVFICATREFQLCSVTCVYQRGDIINGGLPTHSRRPEFFPSWALYSSS